MPRIPINSCGHIDFPCCGCDNVMLTGIDALEAMREEDDLMYAWYDDEQEKYEQGQCPYCLSSPCVCDQLHDMFVEDRLGGGW